MLAEIAYDSTPLLDLHRQFVAVAKNGLRVVNFFEQRKTRVLRLGFIQWEEFVSKPRFKYRLSADSINSVFENHQRHMTDTLFTISAFPSIITG
jgi:hypothetical protein